MPPRGRLAAGDRMPALPGLAHGEPMQGKLLPRCGDRRRHTVRGGRSAAAPGMAALVFAACVATPGPATAAAGEEPAISGTAASAAGAPPSTAGPSAAARPIELLVDGERFPTSSAIPPAPTSWRPSSHRSRHRRPSRRRRNAPPLRSRHPVAEGARGNSGEAVPRPAPPGPARPRRRAPQAFAAGRVQTPDGYDGTHLPRS